MIITFAARSTKSSLLQCAKRCMVGLTGISKNMLFDEIVTLVLTSAMKLSRRR